MSTLGNCTVDGCNGPLCTSGDDVVCESCGTPYPEHELRVETMARRKIEEAQAAEEKRLWEEKLARDAEELVRRRAEWDARHKAQPATRQPALTTVPADAAPAVTMQNQEQERPARKKKIAPAPTAQREPC